MEVKGVAVSTIPGFVISEFGNEGYRKWYNELSPDAKDVFETKIMSNSWFPLKEIMTEPTQLICDLFYGGDLKGAFKLGSYSANFGLTGVYKLFVKFGSPEFIITRAPVILPTYYRPSAMEFKVLNEGKVLFSITEFAEMSRVIEHRIAGWMQRGLEICGTKNTNVQVVKSKLDNNPSTEILALWGKGPAG